MATRAKVTRNYALFFTAAYIACYTGFPPFNLLPTVFHREIVPVLPFWAIVSFGAYLLFRLGYGIYTFNDAHQAYDELMREVNQAKTDLKKLGIECN